MRTRRLSVPSRLQPLVAWRWFPHAGLFVLASTIRITWVAWVDRVGFVLNDALMYHSNAVAITQGLGYRPPQGGPSAQWTPGYSTVLSGLYRLFGTDPIVGELFNAVVGAVTVVALMLLVERMVDRRTAIVAGVTSTVMPGLILWTDVLVTETLYTALFVTFLLVLSFARPTWRWLVLIGFVMGIGGLVRGEALTWGLLPIVLFWRDLPRLELVKRIGAIAAVVVVVLLPWTIRNAIVMDAFVPVATNASQTLWTGHNERATGGQVYPTEEYYLQFPQDAPDRELESTKALRNDALEYMVTHPIDELRLIPLKLIHLNRGDSYALDWVNAAPDAPPVSAVAVERIGVVADAAYYGLLTLTVLGMVMLGASFWGSRMGRVLTASFLTALFLYGFLYYGNYRYRLPYEPLMIVVTSTLLTRMWTSLRRPGADGA
jgi:4-amino-4-deoxy-L-arabinose transferase-like glycosyltransferase